jgi:hypothetical protein
LTKELKDLNAILKEAKKPVGCRGKNPKGNKSKPYLVSAVIEARKSLILNDSEWVSKRLVIRDAQFIQTRLLLERRRQKESRAALPFYNFDTDDPT